MFSERINLGSAGQGLIKNKSHVDKLEYVFDLIVYVPVNNFSVMSRWVFLG